MQPSELAKPALIVFLAFFIALRSRAINTRYTLLPAAVAVGLVTLAVVVADLGTAVVLVATAATLFFIAGLEWRFFMLALLMALLGSLFAVASKPYRLTRDHRLHRSRITRWWKRSTPSSTWVCRPT